MKHKLFLTALLACLLCALPVQGAETAKSYRVICASFFGPGHPTGRAMTFFKQKLEADSKGAFSVVLKPNNEAGGEEQILELVKRGTIQIALAGGLMRNDEPLLTAWEQPFIIKSWEHARRIFFNPDVKQFEGQYTRKTGVIIKGYAINGFRQISSTFPLSGKEDFSRLRIRIPLNDSFEALFKAFGAKPVAMPLTEVYAALEHKLVDGQDNPYSTVRALGWWEVQNYMLESRHIFSPTFVLVNGSFYHSLPEHLQQIFDDCLTAGIEENWRLSKDDEIAARAFLLSKGVNITQPDSALRQHMHAAAVKVYNLLDRKVAGAKEFREFCASLEP